MENKKSYGLNIGASSILVVIVILCLVCFAGLSISSANADYRLSKKLAERTTDYYNACNEAQLTLRNLTEKEPLSDSLTFYCTINENQALEVSIDTSYKITAWKVVTLSEPELDESLPVLLGND